MRLALRTTVEGFSAGTRVELILTADQVKEGWQEFETIQVSPISGPDRNYMFDVNVDDLVVLRKRGNRVK